MASFTGGSVGDGKTIVPLLGWQVLLGEQVSPLGQLPQLSVPPQPSGMLPQLLAAQVWGVQVLTTHTLLTQVSLVPQVPQLSVPPQPSGMLPQFLACAVQLVGVQPPLVWHVPLTHDSPTGQVQVIVPPQPSDTGPQAAPTPPEPHVFGVHAG